MRNMPLIAVAVAGIILVTAKILTSKPDIDARSSGGVAYRYMTTKQKVEGLHVALPHNLRHFPVEHLVPLP